MEIEAKITSDSYTNNFGNWQTSYYVELDGTEDFDDILKKFEGKKVKIIIEEI